MPCEPAPRLQIRRLVALLTINAMFRQVLRLSIAEEAQYNS